MMTSAIAMPIIAFSNGIIRLSRDIESLNVHYHAAFGV